MRAKFIYEAIGDVLKGKTIGNVLKGKSEEEISDVIEKEFLRKNKVTIKQAQKIVNELNELDVNAKLKDYFSNPAASVYISDMPIEIKQWHILNHNRVILESPTKAMGEELLMAAINFSTSSRNNFKLEGSDGGLQSSISISDAKKLIRKIKLGIKYFSYSDKQSNLYDKYDSDAYHEWSKIQNNNY
jgi:hypothetical protein